MVLSSTMQWVEGLVPLIVKENCREKDIEIEESNVVALEGMKENWASLMFEINVTVRKVHGNNSLTFLAKIMPEDEEYRKAGDCGKQFFNEIYFYSTILPNFLAKLRETQREHHEKLYPKCCFFKISDDKIPENVEDTVLVLENLKTRNFKLGDRVSLDLKHCSLALRCLASFHALSYFMKRHSPEIFKSLADSIEEITYSDTYNSYLKVAQNRVLRSLTKEESHYKEGVARLRQIAERKPTDVLRDAKTAEEPFAVICHGDFLRNNILFRYENDEPVEMKFIDFQKIIYASPAIDVSHLICMNGSHELRTSHFDYLLRLYYDTLTEELELLCRDEGIELDNHYSYESFINEMRRCSIYSYILASNFIPTMMSTEEELAELVKIWTERADSPIALDRMNVVGGPKAETAITGLAKNLIDMNFV